MGDSDRALWYCVVKAMKMLQQAGKEQLAHVKAQMTHLQTGGSHRLR